MEGFIFVISFCLSMAITEGFALYRAKKCNYNCAECKNWHCRKKSCWYARKDI